MITFIQNSKSVYAVVADNGKYLGDLCRDIDGYFYFWLCDDMYGAYSQTTLEQIVTKLKELNLPWDTLVKKELS